VPTASGITQARTRLGPKVLAEVFETVAGPVADTLTRGAWLRGWRLMAIDGFDLDIPDTPANAAEFGYAGSGDGRSAFPTARVVALAECGTHAFAAAEVGPWAIGDFDALQETAFLLRVPTDARRLLESLLEAGDGDVEECGLVR